MKLELKHLAPYLPYKLKMLHYNKEKVLNAGPGISVNWVGITHALNHQENTKPLLHPLSRLTEKMARDFGYATKQDFIVQIQNKSILVNIWNDLISNHYDVFGLIRKGLAEPIETFKANAE